MRRSQRIREPRAKGEGSVTRREIREALARARLDRAALARGARGARVPRGRRGGQGGAGKTTRYRLTGREPSASVALGLLTPAELQRGLMSPAGRTRHLAKTRQIGRGGFMLQACTSDITPNPPPRHGNQQGSVSEPPAPDGSARGALRRGPRKPATPSARPSTTSPTCGPSSRGSGRRGSPSPTCGPRTSSATRGSSTRPRSRRPALRRLDHPDEARGGEDALPLPREAARLLLDPSAHLELPRIEKHLPRLILTEAEARRIVDGSSRPLAARAARPRDPRDALRHGHPRRRARERSGPTTSTPRTGSCGSWTARGARTATCR